MKVRKFINYEKARFCKEIKCKNFSIHTENQIRQRVNFELAFITNTRSWWNVVRLVKRVDLNLTNKKRDMKFYG